MNLFQRAAKNLNLSAVERGIYHFVQLMAFSLGPIGTLPFVADLMKSVNGWLMTGNWTSFDYLGDLHLLAAMLFAAAVAAFQHYKTTRNDPPLANTFPTVQTLTITGTNVAGDTVAENVTATADPQTYFRSGASLTPPAIPADSQ